MSSNPPPPAVQPEPLTALDRFWLDTTRGTVKQSIGSFEDAAKQMIAVTTLAQTIYFAAISFGNAQKTLAGFDLTQRVIFALALAAPLVLWVISLWFAVLVFKPEAYQTNLDSPDLAHDTYYEIVTYKHGKLRWAHIFLVAGFGPLILDILAYLIFFPAPTP